MTVRDEFPLFRRFSLSVPDDEGTDGSRNTGNSFHTDTSESPRRLRWLKIVSNGWIWY